MSIYPARSNTQFTDRASVQTALLKLLHPLAPFTTPSGALIHLGETATHYDATAAALEGYARPLWGVAALLAGGGGDLFPESQRWVSGLLAGTDPESPEYWGEVRDKDQRMVEMAPVGWWLCMCGGGDKGFWKTFSEEERKRVVKWLSGVNERSMPDTNWLWFRVFANLGLKAVGEKYDAERVKRDMDHLDTFYVGEGWSADGPVETTKQFDYYSGPFAIQTSQLIYSVLAKEDDPERCENYRERARQYAAQFVHYFDPQGRAIPFGRSTTYRFAMSSFWGTLAFADVPLPAPLTWGAIRGLLLRNLRWWSTQPIFTPAGTLSIGYSYPNQFFTENYNSAGSPYWGCKAFICLAVPESHPFWTEPEQLYPSSELPQAIAMPKPNHIINHLGGHTFLLSSGQRCSYPLKATQAKYGKYAYSSAFAFSVPTGSFMLEEHAPDSTLALSRDGGETWATRRVADNARIEYREDAPVLISGWTPWEGVDVETTLIPPCEDSPNWYIRIQRIKVAAGQSKILSADAGWSLYGQDKQGRHLPPWDGEEGTGGEEGEAWAVSGRGVVGVKELRGARAGRVIRVDANANLVESRTVLPLLEGELVEGEAMWATAVFAVPEEEGWRGKWRAEWAKCPDVPAWAGI